MNNKIFFVILMLALPFAVFAQDMQQDAINNAQYYVANNGYPTGPFTLVQMNQLVRSRKVAPTTLVWKDGIEWTQAGLVPELFGMFNGAAIVQQSPMSQNDIAQNGEYQQQIMMTDMMKPQGRVQTLTEEQKSKMPDWVYHPWYADWLVNKYPDIDFTDKAMMQSLFNKHKNAGIGLAVGGCFIFWIGIACPRQFYLAGAIGHIYKAVNGHKLFSDMQMTDTDKMICSLGDNGKAPIELLP